MGMSTFVKGFRPPDKKWKEMKAAYDACTEAGVEVPEKVEKFFNYCPPNENGIEVDLDKIVKEAHEDSREIFELRVKDIPDNVTVIQFINSY